MVSLDKEDKGSIYMFEAISAAVLLLTAVIFAQSITAITPLTASTASQNVENQQGELGKSFIVTSTKTESLSRTLRYWDTSENEFHGASAGATRAYRAELPENSFGDDLERYFTDQGIGVRIDLLYLRENSSGEIEQRSVQYLDNGVPSNHAHKATTTIEIYGDDPLIDEDGNEKSITVEDESEYIFPDIDPSSNLHNVVTVEITVWQI